MDLLSTSDLAARALGLTNDHGYGLRPVALAQLEPFLRGLLFSSQLVTRALETHSSAQVRVSVEAETREPISAAHAGLLEINDDQEAVRRQVAIRLHRSSAPAIFAESFIVPDRLPPKFLQSLATNREGIGATLEELGLATRRELLCFGLTNRVPWRNGSVTGEVLLLRLYRIVTDKGPGVLITEAFVVSSKTGEFHLANVCRSPARRELLREPGTEL